MSTLAELTGRGFDVLNRTIEDLQKENAQLKSRNRDLNNKLSLTARKLNRRIQTDYEHINLGE